MFATLMTLLDSFWTKYGNFGQSACCQEGYECGGTIADKSRLEGGRRQALLLSRLLSRFFVQNELTLTHNRENRWRADIRVILSVKFLAKRWQWSFSKLTLKEGECILFSLP